MSVLVLAFAMLACVALRSAAQSTPGAVPSVPKSMTMPTADSTVKAAAGAVNAGAAKATTLSDSARAALQAQIGRELRTLGDSLKLTPDQKAKAKPILIDHALGLAGIRDKYAKLGKSAANTATMKQEVLKLRDATDAKLAAVLTAPQMTTYKAKRDQWAKSAATKLGLGALPH